MKQQSAVHTYLSFERGSASDACVTRAYTSPANCLPAIQLRGIAKCDHRHACSSSQRVETIRESANRCALSLIDLHYCLALAHILSDTHTLHANLFYTLAVKIEIDDDKDKKIYTKINNNKKLQDFKVKFTVVRQSEAVKLQNVIYKYYLRVGV